MGLIRHFLGDRTPVLLPLATHEEIEGELVPVRVVGLPVGDFHVAEPRHLVPAHGPGRSLRPAELGLDAVLERDRHPVGTAPLDGEADGGGGQRLARLGLLALPEAGRLAHDGEARKSLQKLQPCRMSRNV